MAIGGKRTPRGKAASQWAPITRDDFFYETKEAGWTVEIVRHHKGEWNEHRAFFVNGTQVGAASKGERPDWEQMTWTVRHMISPPENKEIAS